MQTRQTPITFCGETVGKGPLSLIVKISERYSNLSRTELANTVCELLGWRRANGRLKTVECRQFLERLQARSMLHLPAPRAAGRPRGSRTRVVHTAEGGCATPLIGTLAEVKPITIKRVETARERALWRELVDRYHYLGHRVPFGAHLRYLILSERLDSVVLGCVQFSSAAWRMRARDQWIGWDDARRGAGLPHVVCNSRFLILPRVQVRHLASHALALAARALRRDWPAQYGVTPWLVETLVDPERFSGTCYRAANWIEVGQTTGRGRQDRHHQRHDAHPKTVFLYPLRPDGRRRLCGL
ncbi:MAG TPA: DUF4338 domain-containing protein [Anaerolineales bacterium]|nr:DUF4338 domain-containing protein [Anaerolineales bacterium]